MKIKRSWKLVIGSALCCFIAVNTYAQTSIGARVGSSIMGFTGNDKYATELGGSFSTAFFIRHQLESPWNLQAEINYQRSGYIYERKIFPRVHNLRLHYVRMPLLVGYRFKIGELSPSVFTGPSLGILNSVQGSRAYSSEGYIDDAISNQQTSKINMAWTAGISADYHFNNFFVTADMRYLQGLSSVDKGAATRARYDLHQSGLIFTAGVGIDLH